MNEVTKAKERSSKAIECMFAGVAGISLIAGGFVEFLSNSINGKWGIFLGILLVMLITLGSVIITSLVGTLLFKNTGLIELIKHQLVEIMTTNGFIQMLSKERLQQLKIQTNELLYSSEIAKDDTSDWLASSIIMISNLLARGSKLSSALLMGMIQHGTAFWH